MSSLPLPTSPSDAEFAALVESARNAAPSASEIGRLALHLAKSGQQLSWKDGIAPVDIASTGGPGSLSTLLGPLVLNSAGEVVVKLAVPGRPAGAIDVLGTVPGYRVRMTPQQVRDIVASCGFAHFLADDSFAPLDASLFAYRRKVGAVALPILAAASLLSKKVAVGLRSVGLDIRVGPHGNFGLGLTEARNNGRLFCSAAAELNVSAVAFICPGELSPQPWIGRGEALLALAMAVGLSSVPNPDIWLADHILDCTAMACHVLHSKRHLDKPDSQISPSSIQVAAVRGALVAHLVAQGASMDAFQERVAAISSATRTPILAKDEGVLEIDLASIRDTLITYQSADGGPGFSDCAGIQLLAKPGSWVEKGNPLALVRHDLDSALVRSLLDRLQGAFYLSVTELSPRSGPTTSADYDPYRCLDGDHLEVIHA